MKKKKKKSVFAYSRPTIAEYKIVVPGEPVLMQTCKDFRQQHCKW